MCPHRWTPFGYFEVVARLEQAAARGWDTEIDFLCLNYLLRPNAPLPAQADVFKHPLKTAVRWRHYSCVPVVLEYLSHFPIDDCRGICALGLEIAAETNNVVSAPLLLRYCCARDNNSMALQKACQWGNQEIFDFLYPLSDPNMALRGLQSREDNTTLLDERLAQERLRAILAGAVGVDEHNCASLRKI